MVCVAYSSFVCFLRNLDQPKKRKKRFFFFSMHTFANRRTLGEMMRYIRPLALQYCPCSSIESSCGAAGVPDSGNKRSDRHG